VLCVPPRPYRFCRGHTCLQEQLIFYLYTLFFECTKHSEYNMG
jgi:hypothetical protein